MDRPEILTEEIDKLKINRLEAVGQLNQIADNIAQQIVELKATSIVDMNLSGLFPSKNTFTAEEINSIINTLVTEIQAKIRSTPALNELEGINNLLEIFNTLLLMPLTQMSLESAVNLIDSCFVDIANSSEIPVKTKSKFFDVVKGEIDDRMRDWLVENLKDSESIPTDSILPINVFYILNTQSTQEGLEKAKTLKRFIKDESTKILEELRSDPNETILAKYGDYVIDQDIEDYESQTQYNQTGPKEYIQNSIPEEILANGSDELKEVLYSTDEKISIRKFRIAKIQLLRIYREYINTRLGNTAIIKSIIDEQLVNNPNADNLRIGIDTTNAKEEKRRIKTRRISLFNSAHMGMVKSHEVNFNLDNKNYLPVSQKLIDFWMEGGAKSASSTEVYNRLNPDQQRKFKSIEALKDIKLPQSKLKDEQAQDQEILKVGLPEEIIKRSLRSLGIGSSDDLAAEQISAYESKSTPDTSIKTYALKLNFTEGISVDHRYRIFSFPASYNKSLKSLMVSIAHESGHIFQQIARDTSILPGLNKLESLGRSDILAESGAIKVDSAMHSLFGEGRDVNTYHFDIIRMITEGKNYWEIFNEIFRIIKERNIKNNETTSTLDLVKTVQKVIARAYGNLGAKGNDTNQGRYPTNAGLLAYTYQGMEDYSDQPFYVSGIPSHRSDLKGFLPQPMIDGNEITESVIAGKIIDATYQVLIENNIIKEN